MRLTQLEKNFRKRAENCSLADMGLSSESQRGDKNESKRIGVGLGLASTLVPAGAGCPAGLCGVKQIDALTKNLFSQGEVWVSPGKFSGPYQKPIFSRG